MERLRAGFARAARLPVVQRAWTIRPPADWTVELPLHDRLEQRAQWEQWEREADRISRM